MSDVGLGATLDLNIADALRRIDQLGAALNAAAVARVTVDTTQVAPQITSAVEAADTAVLVTGDAAEVTGSIDAAVDAADTGVIVTGDAGELTGDITAAVDNADTAVTITGDAAQLTGAIDAAVQNADTSVTVSGSVPPSLAAGASALGDSLDAAATSGISLGGILAGLSVGGAVAGLRALGDAASDLQESTTKAQVVFGAQFGQIEQFAQAAATATGLSEQAALEAAGTFGNLFQALGSSREEASKLAPEVVQLGADLASFNNIPVDEALEKIRSGLVGEIEPLRSLGVSFLAADVEAKGLELGLGDLNGKMSEGEKVQARYALIVEQTAFAQGDFARTAEGLANQQRTLSAELKNAAAAAGTLLLPAFQAILAQVSDNIPGLQSLAESVLPAVADALINLSPLIGTSVDLLVLLAPVVTVVAEALAAIPSEAISIGAALLVANKGFGLLGSLLSGIGPAVASVPGILRGVSSAVPAATSGVGALGTGVQGLAGKFAALNPFVVAAALGTAAVFKSFSDARDRAADVAAVVGDLRTAFQGIGTVFGTTDDALQKFITELVDSGDKIQSTSALFDDLATAPDVFNALGISAAQAADLIAGGAPAIDAFGRSLGGFSDEQGAAVVLLKEFAGQTGEAAKSSLAAMAATDELSDAHKRELETLGQLDAPGQRYIDLLDRAGIAAAESARETEAAAATTERISKQFLTFADAIGVVADEAPRVNSAIDQLGTGETDRKFLNIALAIDEAALSEEGFAAAATRLGTDAESLRGFIDTATGAIDDFVSTATAGLPTVADVFSDAFDDAKEAAQDAGEIIREAANDRAQAVIDAASAQIAEAGEDLGEGAADRIRQAAETRAEAIRDGAEVEATALEEGARVTASAFTQGLLAGAAELADFRGDLEAIVRAGFPDVAGLLAEQGQEAGGALADELHDALVGGSDQLLVDLSAANAIFQAETKTSVDFMRDVLGPELILTSGLIGQGAADALFENVSFAERIRIQGELAGSELSEQGQVLAVIAATEGEHAARAYGETVNLDAETIEAAVAAGVAMKEHAPVKEFTDAGVVSGVGYVFGVGGALRFSQPSVDAETRRMATLAGVEGNKRWLVAGQDGAMSYVFGINGALRFSQPSVNAEVERMVALAHSAGMTKAQSDSPSKLFAQLGQSMGEGVAVGLDEAGAQVIASAEQIVRQAADAVARVAPDVTAEISAGPPGGGTAGGPGAVPETVVRALEAIAAQGGGESLQIGPFHGGDVRNNLREASVELQAIRRRRR